MSVSTQVALGLAPAIIACAILAVVSRGRRVINIIIGALLAAACAAVLILHPFPQDDPGRISRGDVDSLGLAYATALEGSPNAAGEILNDLRNKSLYTADLTLCAARVALMGGDYAAADLLYAKAEQVMPEIAGERQLSAEILSCQNRYMAATGLDERNSAHQEREQAVEAATEELEEILSEFSEESGSAYPKAADYIVYAEEVYSKTLASGELPDKEQIQRELKRLNTFIKDNSEFSGSAPLRTARVKLQLLCDDYKGIAESADDNSDYNELLVISELYLNKYIKNSDFSDEYGKVNVEQYQAVADQLNLVYNNYYQEKSRDERKEVKTQLDAMKRMIKNPALMRVQEGLLEYADAEYSSDASKVYLQLAKVEHAMGDEFKTTDYLDKSLDTAGDCDDAAYALPMYEIISVITDKDNPERLKNVAASVNQALSNNMTLPIPESSEIPEGLRDSEGEGELAAEFSTRMQTYVSQKRMFVNIVNVDTTDFNTASTVRATVTLSSSLTSSTDELRRMMSVTDCGVDIPDFTLEKVDYTGANILLCVDVSGSMGGAPIANLRSAVELFVQTSDDIESICLVAFNNYVTEVHDFGTPNDTLLNAARSLGASGGTNMYGALVDSIEKFTIKPGEINCVILMSDGADNYPRGIEDIEQYIGRPCMERGITVYSVGFGQSADAGYLNSFAAATGGAFLYADDPTANASSNQLGAFFDGLRAQILNQYLVTLKAVDTLSYKRELKISLSEDDLGLDSDTATYYLSGESDSIGEPDESDTRVYLQGKAVYGFDVRLLYKSTKSYDINLLGEGFEANDGIRLSITGNNTGMKYDLGAKFASEGSIAVTVPAGVAADVYDVFVVINGKTAVLDDGLAIFVQGGEKITKFGPYIFTSYIKYEDAGQSRVTLSGYVNLNGWLNFNKDIVLTGDLDGYSVNLTDTAGSYVRYYEATSEGLASYLAKKGMMLKIDPVGSMNIYNDTVNSPSSDDYQTDPIPLGGLTMGNLITIAKPGLHLYPDRANFNMTEFKMNLPFSEKILKSKLDLFKFDVDSSIIVASRKVGMKIDLEYGAGKTASKTFNPVNLGNLPIYISPQEAELHIDTVKGEYEVKFITKFAFVSNQDSMGFSLKWDNDSLLPCEIKAYYDHDITAMISGVPVTYSDFMLGVTDIDTSKPVGEWMLTGSMDVAGASIKSIPAISGAAKWVGDLSILKLDKATLKLRLCNFYLGASGTLKFLEHIEIASAEMELGSFPYTSTLLQMYDEPVSGFRLQATIGPKWVTDNTTLKLQGTGEIAMLSKFLGLTFSGEFEAELRWWICKVGVSKKGSVLLGVRTPSGADPYFILRAEPGDIELRWPEKTAGSKTY